MKSCKALRGSAAALPAVITACALWALLPAAGAHTARTSHADRAHAQAVEAFRQGRFPQAYGGFVMLAEAGHALSARYALWMCEHGPALFGHDWDCGPEQVADWAQSAGLAAPAIGPRLYPASVVPKAANNLANTPLNKR